MLNILWSSILALAGLWLWFAFLHSGDETAETWLIPEGYVGWLRLDYSVTGAPPLPRQKGRYVIRVPKSGRVLTSTTNIPPIVDNQYLSEGFGRLAVSRDINPDYAVQNAFSFGRSKPNAPYFRPDAECVFVGTYAELKANRQDCKSWARAEPQPPEYKKHAPPENRTP
jgi:hypothetical protein